MNRKIAVVATVIVVASVTGWLTLRGPYHQWRWAACREAAERLRNGTNTRVDEFFSLIRGRPKTYAEYYEAATGHEDALIKLNYLARKEFRLRNPLSSNSAMDQFSAAATKRFPKTREWSCVFSALGDSLVITTVTKRMQDWEKFIREYDSAGASGTFRGCERRFFGARPASVAS